MRLKNFAARHPWLAAGLICALFLGFQLITGTVVAVIARRVFHLTLEQVALTIVFLGDTVLALLLSAVLTAARAWHGAGFTRARDWRRLYLYLLPLAFLTCSSFALVVLRPPVTLAQLAGFAATALLIGFVEEGYFRGVMLRILLPKGAFPAALATALLFGALHAGNVLSGFNPTYVLAQVFFAAGWGFMFAALRLRTGTIWIVILLHAWQDFAALTLQGRLIPTGNLTTAEIIAPIGVGAIYALYGLFILRARGPVLQGAPAVAAE